MNQKHTSINSVGEFGLIERIRKICASVPLPPEIGEKIVLGIDDDTAVVRPSEHLLQLVTSDIMVEGVHFDLTYTSMEHLGWKLLVVNLSDIAAMGGIPLHAVITVALPAKISVEMVEAMYGGIAKAAETYRCAIVGGDTNTSLGNMTVAATVTGEVSESWLKLRSGAQPGDRICVSGDLGLSHAGLKILLREKERYLSSPGKDEFKPNLTPYTVAVTKHLAPRARFDVAQKIAGREWVHAMIDISDGLASDLRHICVRSRTGAHLDIDKLRIPEQVGTIAAELGEEPMDFVLYGGEEYELLFTVHPDAVGDIEQVAPEVSVIGTVTADAGKIELVRNNEPVKILTGGGYDHFRK
jgi:thiamine-monophosphate kinase